MFVSPMSPDPGVPGPPYREVTRYSGHPPAESRPIRHRPGWHYDPIGRPWDKPLPGDKSEIKPVPPHYPGCMEKYLACIGKKLFCYDCLGMCQSLGYWDFTQEKCNYLKV